MSTLVSAPDDVLTWLLDPADPGPRYLALRDLARRPPDDPELLAARNAAHAAAPIRTILDRMAPEGYWERPGAGYNPKYRSTVWALITLAQSGATAAADERIALAGNYLLDHALAPGGQFSTSPTAAPSGTVDCLQGNLLAALLDLGVADDPRVDLAFDWMARTVTGDGIAPAADRKAERRYYAYKSGPLFECGVNGNQPCAWGAVKVMLAFGKLPAERRTPEIEAAITLGIKFLLGTDPATAAYPQTNEGKPNRSWWKFGFPVFYVTDILQNVEALVALGHGGDPRLANGLALVRDKADAQGRWVMEYDLSGKLGEGVDFGPKRQPNKWVTIRALRALAG